MVAHDKDNLKTTADLDQIAEEAACLDLKIHGFRDQLANLPKDQRDASILAREEERLLSEMQPLVIARNANLEQVLGHVEVVARSIANGVAMRNSLQGINQSNELVQAGLSRIVESISKYKSPSQTTAKSKDSIHGDDSQFLHWAAVVMRNAIIDFLRSRELTTNKLNREQKGMEQRLARSPAARIAHGHLILQEGTQEPKGIDALDYREASVKSRRVMPITFSSKEVKKLQELPPKCRDLFLYSTGLWNRLDAASQNNFVNGNPGEFALQLNAIDRANRFAQREAETTIRSMPLDDDVDIDAQFEIVFKKAAGKVAQDLNRHFWKFLLLETPWQYLFSQVVPWENDELKAIEKELDRELLSAYLFCDVFMGIDTAARCSDWLRSCQIENTANANLGRIAGQLMYIESGQQVRANQYKWELVCRMGGITDESVPEPFVEAVLSEESGPRSPQFAVEIAKARRDVDLPLAFELRDVGGSQHG